MQSWLEGRIWVGKGAQATGMTASLRIQSSKADSNTCESFQGLCSEHVWIIWWLNHLRSLELGELTYIYCLKATLDVKHLFSGWTLLGNHLGIQVLLFLHFMFQQRLSKVYGSKWLQAKDYVLEYWTGFYALVLTVELSIVCVIEFACSG